MIALGVIYPQFLATNTIEAENNFYSHLKATFCVPSKVGPNGKTVPALLPSHNLDLQCSHFKMTRIHSSEVVMRDSENNFNPMTRLWCKITTSPTLNQKFSKYMKVTKITTVQVLGSVKNKCTFNTLNFMKNSLRNRLGTHLDTCKPFDF
jgi:hypothetical protein